MVATMQASGTWRPALSTEGLAALLRVAWDGVHAAAAGRAQPTAEADRDTGVDGLALPLACFVTLHDRGTLRGCMGSLHAAQSLGREAWDNGRRAASHDPRFEPIAAADAAVLQLDVTVLGPMRPIDDLADFVPGEHGILLECEGRRAVFLPQVAVEQGWDRAQTYAALARKAGLRHDVLPAASDARLSVFEAVVVCEEAS